MLKKILEASIFEIIIIAVIIFLFGNNPNESSSQDIKRDSVIVQKVDTVYKHTVSVDTVKVIVPGQITNDSLKVTVYKDSIETIKDSIPIKVKHTITVPDSGKIVSNWNINVLPYELQKVKTVTKTITKRIMQKVEIPFYQDKWFYVAIIDAIIIMITIWMK